MNYTLINLTKTINRYIHLKQFHPLKNGKYKDYESNMAMENCISTLQVLHKKVLYKNNVGTESKENILIHWLAELWETIFFSSTSSFINIVCILTSKISYLSFLIIGDSVVLEGRILKWFPVTHPLHNPLSMSMGGTCNLFLMNGIWQWWWNITPIIMLF